MGDGEPETALVRRPARVVDVQHARHCLLLQPLPRVPLGDAGAMRKLGGRERSRAGERVVQAEAKPQLDVRELHRREACVEQRSRELLDPILVGFASA